MQRDFYFCTAVSTAKTGSPSFCVYPSFVCVYIFVLYIGCCHTLFMIVIYCINKYFIKSSFLQSVHVKGQFRNRDYLWMKPAWARFDLPQNLGCIGSSPTGKTTVRFAFIYNFHAWGQCHLVLPHSTFWGIGGWVFRETSKWRFAWQFGYGRRSLYFHESNKLETWQIESKLKLISWRHFICL